MKAFSIAPRMRIAMCCAALAIAALDRAIKMGITATAQGEVLARWGGILEIVHTANPGAAFSLLSGSTLFLLAVTTLMLAAVLLAIVFYRPLTPAAGWSLALLLGGGIGNWIDRMTSGVVTDYIRLLFIRFPVFNLADICITISIAALLFLVATDRFDSHTGEHHGTTH